MGKWCLHASLFIFDRIIIKVAVNQDRRKSSVKFDFGRNQTTHFGVTCPWVTKISHFWTWISLKPVGQSWSNFMCSIIGVGERVHKVLGQVDLGTLDSGERSLPFGLLVSYVRCQCQSMKKRGGCGKRKFLMNLKATKCWEVMPIEKLVYFPTDPCKLRKIWTSLKIRSL